MERPGATTLRGNPLTLVGPELKPGDSAPDFNLVDTGLKPVSLKDTGNNVRIISVVPSPGGRFLSMTFGHYSFSFSPRHRLLWFLPH